jgi:hypothetical protein
LRKERGGGEGRKEWRWKFPHIIHTSKQMCNKRLTLRSSPKYSPKNRGSQTLSHTALISHSRMACKVLCPTPINKPCIITRLDSTLARALPHAVEQNQPRVIEVGRGGQLAPGWLDICDGASTGHNLYVCCGNVGSHLQSPLQLPASEAAGPMMRKQGLLSTARYHMYPEKQLNSGPMVLEITTGS